MELNKFTSSFDRRDLVTWLDGWRRQTLSSNTCSKFVFEPVDYAW
jgi:hypothetical protein